MQLILVKCVMFRVLFVLETQVLVLLAMIPTLFTITLAMMFAQMACTAKNTQILPTTFASLVLISA